MTAIGKRFGVYTIAAFLPIQVASGIALALHGAMVTEDSLDPEGELLAALRARQALVLDQAYEPLRLNGAPSLDAAQLDRVWRLLTPNKALGLTGVRAAYAIAPVGASADLLARVRALAPSWPLGAHGVALLHAWATAPCHEWLQHCRGQLRAWKQRQVQALRAAGWTVHPSDTNFFVAARACPSSPGACFDMENLLDRLRAHGIKLRDGASFGLPGQVRIAVAPPPVQDALLAALRQVACPGPPAYPQAGGGASACSACSACSSASVLTL